MNYQKAKLRIRNYRVIGAILSLTGLVYFLATLFKFLTMQSDKLLIQPLTSALGQHLQDLMMRFFWEPYSPYRIWDYIPTLNVDEIISRGNFFFFCIYLTMFVGSSFWITARRLSQRIKNIREMIDNENIARSMRGQTPVVTDNALQGMTVAGESIFKQFHQLYLAPVVGGFILALLLYVLDLN